MIRCGIKGEPRELFLDKIAALAAVRAKTVTVVAATGTLPDFPSNFFSAGREEHVLWLKKREACHLDDFPWLFLAPQETLMFLELSLELGADPNTSAFIIISPDREILKGSLNAILFLPIGPTLDVRVSKPNITGSSVLDRETITTNQKEVGIQTSIKILFQVCTSRFPWANMIWCITIKLYLYCIFSFFRMPVNGGP